MARNLMNLSFDDDCPACEGEGLIVIELVGQAGFQDILVLCDNCVERPVEDEVAPQPQDSDDEVPI